jgi:2-amino-4-hydroxy-6-hydroxymethyldihydropteridine diphosphokinase
MSARSGTPQIYHLGLGSNLNNPLRQLHRAINHLNRLPDSAVIQCSQFYHSAPWGVTDQPDFINAAVTLQSRLTPMMLLKHIKIIEYRLMGRQPNARWHSRVIDIDLLLHEDHSMKRSVLHIPHPLITERCFVIRPLCELRPKMPAYLRQQLMNHPKGCCAELRPIHHPGRRFG